MTNTEKELQEQREIRVTCPPVNQPVIPVEGASAKRNKPDIAITNSVVD